MAPGAAAVAAAAASAAASNSPASMATMASMASNSTALRANNPLINEASLNKAALPWQSLRPHGGQPGKETMPLSPPLTPLPPNLRFPHMPILGPMAPYNPFLLAAQYQQQQQILSRPPQGPQNDFMEQIQRLIQLRNGALEGSLPSLNPAKNDESPLGSLPVSVAHVPSPPPFMAATQPPPLPITQPPTSVTQPPLINNNNLLVKSEDELKREEEMVEDEMKEDTEEEVDDSEDKEAKNDEKTPPESQNNPQNSLITQFQLNLLKKMYEDSLKSKTENGSTGGLGLMACKFNCGKSFHTPFDLYQHQDQCQNNEANVYEESLVSDSNDQDLLFNGTPANGLHNTSNNSSGDERKVRVRTLISDEQLSILKSHYHKNARPKREELERVSQEIGHPFKVVKVWFQNSRARDRREGKPVMPASAASAASLGHLPFFNGSAEPNPIMAASGLFPRLPLLGPLMTHGSLEPKPSVSPRSIEAKSPFSTTSDETPILAPKCNPNGLQPGDQPLDLSNKGSSPSVSPLSTFKDDSEALNLSNPPSGDIFEHFRRAAAAAVSAAGDGGASAVTAALAAAAVNSNGPSSLHLPPLGLSLAGRGPLDIYRFQEDAETSGSGSAGSGGATTDEEGRFTCEKCDKTFTKQSSLSRHKYEHSGTYLFCD